MQIRRYCLTITHIMGTIIRLSTNEYDGRLDCPYLEDLNEVK